MNFGGFNAFSSLDPKQLVQLLGSRAPTASGTSTHRYGGHKSSGLDAPLSQAGGLAGKLIGSFWGPVGGMIGQKAGSVAGDGFANIIDGDWRGGLEDLTVKPMMGLPFMPRQAKGPNGLAAALMSLGLKGIFGD